MLDRHAKGHADPLDGTHGVELGHPDLCREADKAGRPLQDHGDDRQPGLCGVVHGGQDRSTYRGIVEWGFRAADVLELLRVAAADVVVRRIWGGCAKLWLEPRLRPAAVHSRGPNRRAWRLEP
jgi:hypothetical protein